MTKQEIRAAMRAASGRLDPGSAGQPVARGVDLPAFDPAQACRAALSALRSIPEFLNARCILTYMPLPGEVDCTPLLASGRRFVLPRVVGDDLELRLYDPSLLVEGYRGIREPSTDAPLVGAGDIDLAIIPGVAFDRSGMRLGHGCGYYDRLLARLNCPKIGICFSYRLVERIPAEPWDRPVDILITEEETLDLRDARL